MAGAATSSNLPTSSLFNNPTLSDVTIRQVYKGGAGNEAKVQEYHAHKAVLSNRSSFFLKAFTGKLKEAGGDVIEVHDDDPDHFKLALEFMYCATYDLSAVQKLIAEKDGGERVVKAVGVAIVGDKYDIVGLLESAETELRSTMAKMSSEDAVGFEKAMLQAIELYYYSCGRANTSVGKALVDMIMNHPRERKFLGNPELKELMQACVAFGADMALFQLDKGNLHGFRVVQCCNIKVGIPPDRTSFYCINCAGHRNALCSEV